MAEYSPEQSLREIDRRIAEGTFRPAAEEQRQIVELRRQVAQRGEAPETELERAAKFAPRAFTELAGGAGDILNLGTQLGGGLLNDILGSALVRRAATAKLGGYGLEELTGFQVPTRVDVPPSPFFGSGDIIRKGEEVAEQLTGRRVSPEMSLQRPAPPPVLGEQTGLDQAGNVVRAMALPTAAAVAGQMAGTYAQPLLRTLPGGAGLAAAAPTVGESVGSGVGYIANVLAGNESFDWNNFAASLALPGFTKAATNVIAKGAQGLVTTTPGEQDPGKLRARSGVPILSKAGRYNIQEEIKNVRRRANENKLDNQQRLNEAFAKKQGELIDLVQQETGLTAADFTDVKTGSIVAKAKQQGAALELMPRIEKRLREGLQTEAQLGTFTGNVNTQVQDSMQKLKNITRRQDFDAKDLRKSFDEYVDEANRNALAEISRREQAAAGRMQQFESRVKANAPTKTAVEAAFNDVDNYATIDVPRGLFTQAQEDLKAAKNLLQKNFPGPQNSTVGSRLQIPQEVVPGTGGALPPGILPGPGYVLPAPQKRPLQNVPFAAVQEELTDLGRVTADLKRNIAGPSPHPEARETLAAVNKLYASLQETLDTFIDQTTGRATGPVGEAALKLRYANDLNKRLHLAEELTDVFYHALNPPNTLGQTVLPPRKARELLVLFNDKDVFKERLQQTGIYGGLVKMLDDAADSVEEANRLHERLKDVTRLPQAPELVTRPGATPPTPQELAGRRIQEEATALGSLERQVQREPVPKAGEPVRRPGSGGEIYRAGLQGGAIAHAISNSGSLEAAVISSLLLPGHLGYLATTPRGQKLMLDLMKWNGGIIDDKVSGIIGAAVRAGVSGYMTEDEREAINAAAQPTP